ncbi:MAG: hypothetical protein K0R26_1330 [Bacteroidota bacterium]|jgi:hypothetical protein|nr:hypothetical protein [Bacteroidota bacterium]
MIKKIILSISLVYISTDLSAQFFRGVGLFVGATTSSHRYRNLNPVDNVTYAHTFPAPSHRSGEFISFSVGVLGEFLRYEHIRWQTEFEYATKGGIEQPSLFPGSGLRGPATPNTFTNIQWNNFAKIFGNEGYRGTPYLMLGARLEYNMARSITAYPTIAGIVPKINLTPDVGLGYEFASYSKFHFFTELHYNPDAIKMVSQNVVFWQRMWELRIGIIYRPRKAIDDCNAPRYHGSNY